MIENILVAVLCLVLVLSFIFIICCCVISDNADEHYTYNENILDDDVEIDNIMDQLNFDDEDEK